MFTKRLVLYASLGAAPFLTACDKMGVTPLCPVPGPRALGPLPISATWQHPTPQGNDLYRMWGFGDGSFVAVGEAGVLTRFASGTWTLYDTPTRMDLRGVWASAPDDVYACGNAGTLSHFDGTKWELQETETNDDLRTVWGTGTGELFVAGDGGSVWRRQEGTWQEYRVTPEDRLNALWGYASTDVYVGGSRGSLNRFDGTSWNRILVFDDPFYEYEILDMWGPTPGQISFVERRAIIWFDGVDWGYVEIADENAFGIWGLSLQEQVAVSAGSSTHWVNDVRTRYFMPTGEPLFDVWGPTGTDLFAVGRYGSSAHFDVSGWQSLSDGSTNDIQDLWANQADAVAVGDGGMILHQTGSSWTEESVGTGYDLAGVWQQSGFAVAVGRFTLDGFDWRQAILMNAGAQWTDVAPVGQAHRLFDVWGTDPTNVYAVGWGGEILRYEGASWGVIDAGSGDAAFLKSVHGTSADNIIAVGRTDDLRALVCQFDGTSWTKASLPDAEELSAVWVFDATTAFAAGAAGVIERYNGKAWQREQSPTSAPLLCIWGSSPNDVYAGGVNGILIHYDGTAWREFLPSTNRSINSISGRSANEVYFAGDKGAILFFQP